MSLRKSVLAPEDAAVAPSPLRRSTRIASSPAPASIAARRNSAQAEPVSTPAKLAKTKRLSLSQDITEQKASTPTKRGRKPSITKEETPTKTTTQRISTPGLRRSVRGESKSPTNDPEVPKPRGRRPSVTEKLIPLASIDETESKDAKTPATATRGRRPSITLKEDEPKKAVRAPPKRRLSVTTDTITPLEAIVEDKAMTKRSVRGANKSSPSEIKKQDALIELNVIEEDVDEVFDTSKVGDGIREGSPRKSPRIRPISPGKTCCESPIKLSNSPRKSEADSTKIESVEEVSTNTKRISITLTPSKLDKCDTPSVIINLKSHDFENENDKDGSQMRQSPTRKSLQKDASPLKPFKSPKTKTPNKVDHSNDTTILINPSEITSGSDGSFQLNLSIQSNPEITEEPQKKHNSSSGSDLSDKENVNKTPQLATKSSPNKNLLGAQLQKFGVAQLEKSISNTSTPNLESPVENRFFESPNKNLLGVQKISKLPKLGVAQLEKSIHNTSTPNLTSPLELENRFFEPMEVDYGSDIDVSIWQPNEAINLNESKRASILRKEGSENVVSSSKKFKSLDVTVNEYDTEDFEDDEEHCSSPIKKIVVAKDVIDETIYDDEIDDELDKQKSINQFDSDEDEAIDLDSKKNEIDTINVAKDIAPQVISKKHLGRKSLLQNASCIIIESPEVEANSAKKEKRKSSSKVNKSIDQLDEIEKNLDKPKSIKQHSDSEEDESNNLDSDDNVSKKNAIDANINQEGNVPINNSDSEDIASKPITKKHLLGRKSLLQNSSCLIIESPEDEANSSKKEKRKSASKVNKSIDELDKIEDNLIKPKSINQHSDSEEDESNLLDSDDNVSKKNAIDTNTNEEDNVSIHNSDSEDIASKPITKKHLGHKSLLQNASCIIIETPEVEANSAKKEKRKSSSKVNKSIDELNKIIDNLVKPKSINQHSDSEKDESNNSDSDDVSKNKEIDTNINEEDNVSINSSDSEDIASKPITKKHLLGRKSLLQNDSCILIDSSENEANSSKKEKRRSSSKVNKRISELKEVITLDSSESEDEPKTKTIFSALDALIAKKIIEDGSSEDDDDYEPKKHPFVDDEAFEGEEDTPSEGSNDIIEDGESLHSTASEAESLEEEEDYENNSFIDDDESVELLSGEEYDLGNASEGKNATEKTRKKSRIIPVSDSDEDVEKVVVGLTNDEVVAEEGPSKIHIIQDIKLTPKSRLSTSSIVKTPQLNETVSIIDENINDAEEIINDTVYIQDIINETDNLPSLDAIVDAEPRKKNFPISVPNTPNTSILDLNTSRRTSTRKTSLSISENIKAATLNNSEINEKICNAVNYFCASVKDKGGNISLNMSLDYANTSGEDGVNVIEKTVTLPKKRTSLLGDFKIEDNIKGNTPISKRKSLLEFKVDEKSPLNKSKKRNSLQPKFIVDDIPASPLIETGKKRSSLRKEKRKSEDLQEEEIIVQPKPKRISHEFNESIANRSITTDSIDKANTSMRKDKRKSPIIETIQDTGVNTSIRKEKRKSIQIIEDTLPKKSKSESDASSDDVFDASIYEDAKKIKKTKKNKPTPSNISYLPANILEEAADVNVKVSVSEVNDAIPLKKSKTRIAPSKKAKPTRSWDIEETEAMLPSLKNNTKTKTHTKKIKEFDVNKLLSNDFKNRTLYGGDRKRMNTKEMISKKKVVPKNKKVK